MTCTTALSMTQVSDTWYALPGGAYAPSLIIRLHDAVSELLILGVEFALYGADDKVGHPARMEVEQLCASSLPRMPLVTCYGGMILSAANTKECPENRHTAISSVTGVFSPDFLYKRRQRRTSCPAFPERRDTYTSRTFPAEQTYSHSAGRAFFPGRDRGKSLPLPAYGGGLATLLDEADTVQAIHFRRIRKIQDKASPRIHAPDGVHVFIVQSEVSH